MHKSNSSLDTELVSVKVNYMEDNKRKLVYVHEKSPNVIPSQGIHIHDVAVVRERPQAAGLHLV
jgi:hypothetical protein